MLAYHNVVPDDFPTVGDGSLHLRISDFRAQLRVLAETHEVVTLDALAGDVGGEGAGKPRAVLTFDDAYRGSLELGLPTVAEYGIPATLFVSPGLLGAEGFWWDLLAQPGRGALDPWIRRQSLEVFEGRQDRVLEWARKRDMSREHLPELARPASREAVLAAASSSGISVGSHCWSHAALPRLDPEDRANELTEAWNWLATHVPDRSEWLAYPYGLHDAASRRGVEATGYRGAVTGDSGWTDLPVSDRFAVPRINIPSGLTLPGFRLRASGVRLP